MLKDPPHHHLLQTSSFWVWYCHKLLDGLYEGLWKVEYVEQMGLLSLDYRISLRPLRELFLLGSDHED